jgi:uncharacterized protein (DUF488 family)
MQTLYTMGYLAPRSDKKLRDLITMNIPVVDTRYNPTSKHPEWRKEHLDQMVGIAYYWVQDLGNLTYKEALNGRVEELDIKIKDIDAGINQLANILDKHGKACLLCACASKKCHRFIVAEEAVKRLDVRVTHI